ILVMLSAVLMACLVSTAAAVAAMAKFAPMALPIWVAWRCIFSMFWAERCAALPMSSENCAVLAARLTTRLRKDMVHFLGRRSSAAKMASLLMGLCSIGIP